MDQAKIGDMIRLLRKEKGFTQEQLAERFGVSRRTVSRWETGRNLPDLSLLIEMADFFGVSLRELLDGKRKDEAVNQETKETILKAADYSGEEKKRFTRRMHGLFIVGLAAAVIFMALYFTDREDNFLGGMCMGITAGMMVVGVIITSRHAAELSAAKRRLLRRLRGQGNQA